MEKEKFTWLPFFKEMLDKIIKSYTGESLFELYKELYSEHLLEIKYKFPIMDPFSFIYDINGFPKEKIQYFSWIGKKMQLKNEIKDLDGIPSSYKAGAVWFLDEKDTEDPRPRIKKLWEIAKELSEKEEISKDNFQYLLNITKIKMAKISTIMFMCYPNKFFPLDQNTLMYSNKKIKNKRSSDEFFTIQKELAKQYQEEKPYNISYLAKQMNKENGRQLDINSAILEFISRSRKAWRTGKCTKHIKTEYKDTKVTGQTGQTNASNTTWLIFLAHNQKTQNGIYPAILFDKDKQILEVCYGVSEAKSPRIKWPDLIMKYKNSESKNFPRSKVLRTFSDPENNISEIVESLDKVVNDFHQVFNGEDMTNSKNKKPKNIPLNQILYGVPGTGKTYKTVVEALRIIAQRDEEIKKLIEKYDASENNLEEQQKIYQEELIQKFNELKRKGQIKFITFHQNYSYEDFVQGYKPVVKRNDMAYKLIKGPLYEIVDKACSNEMDDFDKIKTEFMKKFPADSEFSTVEGEKFKIVKYLKNSIRLQPKEGKTPYTLPYKLLQELLKKNKEDEIKERKDLEKILIDLNTYKGHSSYFFPILKEFAKIQINNNYVLIIDEINRGNISKIFGELITLIEEDKRIGNKHALTVPLMYKDPEKENNEFGIPNNLYIIGTMNTTDKSIALVDIALRRRFTFVEMKPNAGLITNEILKVFFKELNDKIEKSLGKDHQIGHSYFIGKTKDDLPFLWEHNIKPLLEEYFYGDNNKIDEYKSIYKKYGPEENNKSN